MKVAILQWCDPIDNRGMGTIERISTTSADCIEYFVHQMNTLGFDKFTASDNGQIGIENPEFYQEFDFHTSSKEKLQKKVQEFLDFDSLGQMYIRGEHTFPDGVVEYKWWKIQFRNLH